MGLTRRTRSRIALGLLALLAAAAVVDASRVWRQRQWNALIEADQARLAPAGDADIPKELRFAQAHAQAASGAVEPALTAYRGLQDNSTLGRAARYNGANLLLRQATELRAGPQPGQAIALIELAKEGLREVLRQDSAHWGARYNLERAQRLLADPEETETDTVPDPRRGAERAATTMRGYAPGLP